MKLFLDEMHAPSIAVALTDLSWNVVAVAAEAELRGMSDLDLLARAATAERALVTENVSDFVRLAHDWTVEGRAHAGLIFTNPRRFNRATIAHPGILIEALRRFLDDPPVGDDSWIWWL